MELTRNNIKVINYMVSLYILVIVLTPFFLITQYAQPQADDFTMFEVLHKLGYFNAQNYWYFNWTGRYFGKAIVSIILPLKYNSLINLQTLVLLNLVIFILSLFYLVNSIFKREDFSNKVLIFSILIISYFWLIPSPSEAFYWLPGSIEYQLGFSLLMILFGLLNKLNDKKSKSLKILAIILALLIPGSSEINIIIGAGLLFIYLCSEFLINKIFNSFLLLIFVIFIVFSLISVLAPGNEQRAQVLISLGLSKNNDFYFSIYNSFLIAFKSVFQILFKSPFILFCLLLVTLFRSPLSEETMNKISYKILLLFWILFLSFYVFLHFPFIYKTGTIVLPGRNSNLFQMFFILGFVFMSIISFGKLTLGKTLQISEPFKILLVTSIMLFASIQLLMPNKIQNAYKDLFGGKAKRFNKELEARYVFLKSNKNRIVKIPALSDPPFTIYVTDIDTSFKGWINSSYSLYYGVDSVKTDSTIKTPILLR